MPPSKNKPKQASSQTKQGQRQFAHRVRDVRDDPPAPEAPAVRVRKSRIKHPQPLWWPHSIEDRIALGQRAYDAVVSVAVQTQYGIDNNTVAHLKSSVDCIIKLLNWRQALRTLAEEYTDMLDLAQNAPAASNYPITKIDANTSATFGPATNAFIFGGLLGWLLALEDILNKSAAYQTDNSLGIHIGFIVSGSTAPDLLKLNPAAVAKFTGGVVELHGKLPKPAKYWSIFVDRSDGKGQVFLEKVAAAHFTDNTPLPKKPTTWTYTVQLQNKTNQPVGKVSVASLTVWNGAADQGPEAGW